MQPSTLDLMRDQVRAIYRAITGTDLPDSDGKAAVGSAVVSAESVAQRFAELESAARSMRVVTERVPPFSFAPLLDAIDDERELLLEVAVPGVDKQDVTVELRGDHLTISGLRRGERASNGRTYLHAEIPRGPFHRVVMLPYPIVGEPKIAVEGGVIRVHLSKTRRPSSAKA